MMETMRKLHSNPSDTLEAVQVVHEKTCIGYEIFFYHTTPKMSQYLGCYLYVILIRGRSRKNQAMNFKTIFFFENHKIEHVNTMT